MGIGVFSPHNAHTPCRAPPQLEAAEFMAVCDCPEYLSKVERRLGEEVDRVAQYLDPSTEPKITRTVEKELIQAQVGPRARGRAWSGTWLGARGRA